MTKEQTFNEEIMKIASDVLESGELEAVIRNKVLNAFSDAFERAISWGNVRDAIRNRVEEVLVPYIESYDMGAYVIKLDAILKEILETTAIADNRRILENFKRIASMPKLGMTVSLEEVFAEYCKYVAERVDTADLEVVDECDDPSYECVAVEAQIVKDDEPFGFYSRAGNATLYLHPTDHEQDNLCFAVKLVKWDFNKGYVMKFEAEPTLPGLAHMNDFECYLMALSQAHVELIGCERDLDDEVEPNNKPEYELV